MVSVRTRWELFIVLAASMQFLITSGPMYNYTVFFVELQEEFNTSAIITGWVGSLSVCLFNAGVPLAAVLGSKMGNACVALVGSVLSSAGYLSTSYIPSLGYGYLTLGVMAGLGANFAYSAAGSVMLDWFSGLEYKCRAFGFCSVGASVGVMICGPLLTILNDLYGWRNCLRFLSGLSLVIALPFTLPFFKSPEQPHRQDEDGEKQRSSNEQGLANVDKCVGIVGHNYDQDIDKGNEPGVSSDSSDGIDETKVVHLLLNTDVWLFVWSNIFSQIGWSFVIVNYSSFMDGIGMSIKQIYLSLLTFGASEVVIKIIFALFGDRLRCRKLYLMSASSIGGAMVSGFLTLCKSFQDMIILSTVAGFCRGGLYVSYFPAGDELFKIYGSRAVTSVVLVGQGIGTLLGPLIIGALYDLNGDYRTSLIAVVTSFVLASFTMLFIPANPMEQFRRRCYKGQETGDDARFPQEGRMERKREVRDVGTSNPSFDTEM